MYPAPVASDNNNSKKTYFNKRSACGLSSSVVARSLMQRNLCIVLWPATNSFIIIVSVYVTRLQRRIHKRGGGAEQSSLLKYGVRSKLCSFLGCWYIGVCHLLCHKSGYHIFIFEANQMQKLRKWGQKATNIVWEQEGQKEGEVEGRKESGGWPLT